MFHVNYAKKVGTFYRIVIVCSNSDVFVCALCHFSPWIYSGMDELWLISGIFDSINVTPIHTIDKGIDNSIVYIIPAVHILTSWDTTSKVGKKSATFQAAIKCGYELLYSFWKSEISNQIVLSTENIFDTVSVR